MTGTSDSINPGRGFAAHDSENSEEISIDLNGADLQGFDQWSQKINRSVVESLIMVPFMAGYLVLTFLAFTASALWGLVATVVVASTIVILTKRSARRRRRVFHELATSRAGSISLDDSGVMFRSGHQQTRYDWLSFLDVVEVRRHIYVRLTASSALVIPKRCFETREAAGRFVDAVVEHIEHARGSK